MISWIPQPVQAIDPVTGTMVAIGLLAPALLAYIGITANPENPAAFNNAVSGLTSHLDGLGLISGDMVQIGLQAIPGIKSGQPYIPESFIRAAIDYAYAGSNPLLIDNRFSVDSLSQVQVNALDWARSHAYYGTFTRRDGTTIVLWCADSPVHTRKKGKDIYIKPDSGSLHACPPDTGWGTATELPILSLNSYTIQTGSGAFEKVRAGSDVLVGKTAFPDEDTSEVLLDPSLTVPGTFDGAVAYPMNPGWLEEGFDAIAGSQADVQTPVKPVPVFQTISISIKYPDGTIVPTGKSVSMEVGKPVDIGVLNGTVAGTEVIDHWETKTGEKVTENTVVAVNLALLYAIAKKNKPTEPTQPETTDPVPLPDPFPPSPDPNAPGPDATLLEILKYLWNWSLSSLK